MEQLVNVCLPVSNTHYSRLSTTSLYFCCHMETLQPLIALLLLYTQFMPKVLLVKICRVSRPTLYIYNPERRPFNFKSHRPVPYKPYKPARLRTYQSKICRSRMRAIVKSRRILHCQDYLLFPYPFHRRFIVRFLYLFHRRTLALLKTVRCLCLRPASTRLRYIRLWTGIKITRYGNKSIHTPLISQFCHAKFFFCPICRFLSPDNLLRHTLTQFFPEILIQTVHIAVLYRFPILIAPVLPTSAFCTPYMLPVRCTVTTPPKTLSFNKRLQQHRSYLVSLIPILFPLPYTQRKRMRCQIPHPYVRNYQKSTITYHLTQVPPPSALIPSYPSLPSFQPPCRRTKRKSSHISIPLALYQILHLMPAQWPTAKIMILIHQLFPYPIWLAIPAVYLDYSYLSQFGQFTLDAFPHSLLLTVTTFLNSRTRALFCLRQLDYPFPVQSQKNYTATRIFQSPIRTPPLQGFAYLPG